MTDREIMQQALEALKKCRYRSLADEIVDPAIAALRERLAQPEQEPVACQYAKDVAMPEYRCAGKCQYAQPEQEPVAWEDVLGAIARGWTHDDNKHKTMDVQLAVAIAKEIQDMVIAPPQRKPLTDDEIDKIYETKIWDARRSFARAIEAAHGIKGDA